MNISTLIPVLAATVIIGLGGFFFYRHGVVNYKAGYNQCIGDGAVLATEAGEVLKDEIRKNYKPDDVDDTLFRYQWMRDETDR
jgi:hypothetical protein